jgi:hypothetical protein
MHARIDRAVIVYIMDTTYQLLLSHIFSSRANKLKKNVLVSDHLSFVASSSLNCPARPVDQSGGPSWEVEVGRKDSRTASLQGANINLPAPTSGVATLVQKFRSVGLSAKDMVALSGSSLDESLHTRHTHVRTSVRAD